MLQLRLPSFGCGLGLYNPQRILLCLFKRCHGSSMASYDLGTERVIGLPRACLPSLCCGSLNDQGRPCCSPLIPDVVAVPSNYNRLVVLHAHIRFDGIEAIT